MSIGFPTSIQKLLWDGDPEALNQETHQRLIIERVVNYGTLADWRWLVARYGANNVRTELKMRAASSRSAIRNEAQQLASLIIR